MSLKLYLQTEVKQVDQVCLSEKPVYKHVYAKVIYRTETEFDLFLFPIYVFLGWL